MPHLFSINRQGVIDGDLDMNSNQINELAAGTLSTDAVNKGQLDAAVTGLSWKEPVTSKDYLGTRTITQIDALSPTSGQTVVAGDAGTPSAGTSSALVAGSVAEYDGTSWIELVAGSGGFVPDGTRLLVHDETITLFSPLTDGTDESKFAEFDGTTNTPTLTSPADGDAVLVIGDGGVNENKAFVHDTGTATWIQFSSVAALSAGDGIDIISDVVSVDPDTTTGGNIQPVNVVSNGTGVDINAIAGTGIEADGSANLRVATQGDGLTGGGGTTLSIAATNTSIIVNTNDIEAAVPHTADKAATSGAAAADNTDTGVNISVAPAAGSYPQVMVNGIQYEVGDNDTSKDCYFSSTTGAAGVRAFSAIVAGDNLIWNAVIAGFALTANDRIDINYNYAV